MQQSEALTSNESRSGPSSPPAAARRAIEPAFVLSSRFQANASRCRIQRVDLAFEPMAALSSTCAVIFSTVDRDDVLQREAARDAWFLKTTLMLTALEFDDPRLGLIAIVAKLKRTADVVPTISNAVDGLERIAAALMAGVPNPKRQRVLDMLQLPNHELEPVALVANLCGLNTPGWPAGMNMVTDFISDRGQLVRTRKDVRASSFSRVIVPGSMRFAPRGIIFDLLYGGRAPEAVVVGYRTERADTPRPVAMPKNSFFTNAPHPGSVVGNDTDDSDELNIDRWAQDSFWDSIRARHGDALPLSDRDVRVGARFVLFADGSGAFLPEDASVVEISEQFDRGIELEVAEDRLPRKAVRELEDGDIVMMRLSGSGDYLDDVADSLMANAGESGLRANALQWKDRLHEVMKRHGEGMVARHMRELGSPVRAPHYLWAWAGDAVMAPQDLRTFRTLVAAMCRFDNGTVNGEIHVYADERWKEMERVKVYHHRAGLVIRAALVTRVRALIAERKRVDTVQSIELPGVEAGRMGLLRVAAIDGKSMRVPMSRLFHLEQVRAA